MEVQIPFILEVLLPIVSEFYGLTYWGILNLRDMVTNRSSSSVRLFFQGLTC